MFYALNENDVRVPIELAVKKTRYHCPCCDLDVIVKQGKVNAWHFAHKPGSDCDASYTEMTAWHKSWQNRFPEACREVVVQDMTGYKRIADVKIDGITIEFQSKSIPKDIFDARNAHHLKVSRRIAWIFNCIDKEISTRRFEVDLNGNRTGNQWYSWSHPNRLLAKYRYRSWALIDKESEAYYRNIDLYCDTGSRWIIKILYIPDDNDNAGWFLGKPIMINEFVSSLTKSYNEPTQLAIEA